jgi:PAS domain S-box-containing protein
MDGTLDWVRWEIHPWYEADGEIGGIMLFSEVITDRKLAEIALRESEKRFRSVVDSNMIGVVFANPVTGQVTGANDEFLRIANRKRDEMEAGRLNWQAIATSDPGQDEEQQAFRQPTGALRPPFEQEILRPDGTRVPVIIGGSYLDDERGNMVAFVLDNTQRKRAEEELAAAHTSLQLTAAKLALSNRELEQFAFVASHDLQEPLRKIQMFGSGLERQLGETIPQEARDYMNRMQQAADRMQTMISGLLELSRVNTRGRQFEPLNLTGVVEDVISDLEARVHRTGGQIELEALPSMEGDLFQIRQLFQNLIGNALKFHKPGVPPVIHISSTISRSYHSSCITIYVEDNGIGFDQADAGRIFQPFQRLHGRNEYEGTGLGLAICQKIVDRHGGRISVESRVGEGTKFSITLPVHQGTLAVC